jgi:hypothetical protein
MVARLQRMESDMDIDHIRMPRFSAKNPDRSRYFLVESRNLNFLARQQAGEPSLSRSTPPNLSECPGGHIQWERILHRDGEKRSHPLVSPLISDQGSGIERQPPNRARHHSLPSMRLAQAKASSLGGPSSRSRSASTAAKDSIRKRSCMASAM